MAKDIKSLSVRAQKLLEEIRQENPQDETHEEIKEIDKPIKNRATKTPKQKTKAKYFKSSANLSFNPMTYRSLSQNDKRPLWILLLFIMILISVFMSSKTFLYFKNKNSTHDLYAPKVESTKKGIKDIELRMTQLHKEKVEAQNQKNNALKTFPNKIQMQGVVDDVTRLFEMSNMVIVNQEISIQKMQSDPLAQPIVPFTRPNPDTTIFNELTTNPSATVLTKKDASNKEDASKKGNTPKDTKTADASPLIDAFNSFASTKANATPSIQIEGIQYLTMQLTLKGNYLNYLKARNALLRTLPALNIPLEETISNTKKSSMEFRVIYNIPMREESL